MLIVEREVMNESGTRCEDHKTTTNTVLVAEHRRILSPGSKERRFETNRSCESNSDFTPNSNAKRRR